MNDNHKKQPSLWVNVNELTDTASDATGNEFDQPLDVSEMDEPNRRHFMGIMGASMAMASMSGCIRRPVETIVSYREMPEDVLPGIPNYYATGTHVGGQAIGLVVESNEGRPTKVEGNFEHPSSLGGTSGIHQASVLDLYDPLRVQSPFQGLKPVTGDAAHAALTAYFQDQPLKTNGKGVFVLAGAMPSPTFEGLTKRFKQRFPLAKWMTYEPISHDNERIGLQAAYGKPRRAVCNYARARAVLSLDCDFLGTGAGSVKNGSEWAELRGLDDEKGLMSRVYMVEGVMSVTGASADHRLRLAPSQIEAFAFQVALELTKDNLVLPKDLYEVAPAKAKGLSAEAKTFAKAVAADLVDTSKRVRMAEHGVVVVGRRLGPLVHNLAAAMNEFLVKSSGVVSYYDDPGRSSDDVSDAANLVALKAALDAGEVETLVLINTNPVYSAPGDLQFGESLRKAKNIISLADYKDETSKSASWLFPRAHYLEAWGDLVSSTGTMTIQQPLIEPLHQGTLSEIEFLARILGDEPTDGYTLVRKYWERVYGAGGFEKRWRKWLHDGRAIRPILDPMASFTTHRGAGNLLKASQAPKAPTPESLELVFVTSPTLYDGRFANNSWLQECPDPITKICWDNPVMVSPATAKALGVDPSSQIGKTMTPRVALKANGKTVEMAAWIVPGMADNVAAVAVGYGRDFQTFLPYHDKGVVGFDVNPLRTVRSPDFATAATVTRIAGDYPIACLQRYGRQERPGFEDTPNTLVRIADLADYRANPTFAQAGIIQHGPEGAVIPKKKVDGKDVDYIVFHPPERSLNAPPAKGADYTKGYQWGMVIDLNKCTGCNACVVACQAENNIPSVGKNEARYGREMHWLRIDRYFSGSEADPQVVFQPMSCQQCEMAPCENVCPVQATAHSPEGLNDMAYNRCIGTRYCANNCPVKVRRFNFYNYTNASSNWEGLRLRISDDKDRRTKTFDPKKDNQLAFMVRNPDVSVRFRGVMEKCTWCVQRINRAKIKAKRAPNELAAREEIRKIAPACGQACPTGGLTFGNLLDKGNKLTEKRKNNRGYTILSELNIRPRMTYLAKVWNPNPGLQNNKKG
ncbi:MAG: 4Fe-4S dicluster domain-containing protein [Myxococcota bacterium]|nr:4Fe-4S dicluster domain-containing protein [Myxococcota bacterium]